MGKQVEMKILAASLNSKDPFQKKLFDHARRHTNTSSYLKSLIQRDMESDETHQEDPCLRDVVQAPTVTTSIAEQFV
ncbi:hypothetical protein SAMN05444487_1189 [Marininema mesophilum]|uniref:Uncharacterized protein n=1 Tax=Marininema mesophilum TaxID=1048340 RepID=A0A1H3BS33_9BACL|nr:hypothetical protein [Marininema mesophilum]SDX44585.1 hypothetical protein SAMN05444487_1189 [Marininema mesophilum]